ncbi:basic 7S globulin-like [Morus notabilis]|uniref:basic 7S globulin-like n=1 Tax=Morus notabilis TaxID=981085 RepID=UPI000CED0FD5|nr:basic 7S globulin-like [Morus notabilis]
MASVPYNFLLFFSLLFPLSAAQTSSRPKALVLRVKKDAPTLQHYSFLFQRTPSIPIKLTVDLGGKFIWVDCDNGFNSSTKTTVPCHSAECALSGTSACSSNGIDAFCVESSYNPIVKVSSTGDFSQDVVHIQSTDGKNPGKMVRVRKFLFTCAPTSLLNGLVRHSVGIAGLGRSKVAIPSLFSAAFGFPRKFALCLSSSTNAHVYGVVFLGDGPYVFLPGIDMSESLTYTPLILNPVSTAPSSSHNGPSADYFIGVKSIKVNGKVVPLNTSLLSIDGNGVGGTMISTVEPYTVLETSIYKAVVGAFVKALPKNVARVSPVSPFGACFSAKNIAPTRLGPSVPTIDLVFQNEKVVWSIYGTNSMVYVNDKVACLGFVDGGKKPATSIVIGGYQIEDNLFQFDLDNSRLGFSNTLNSRQTTCSNFNFTSTGNI